MSCPVGVDRLHRVREEPGEADDEEHDDHHHRDHHHRETPDRPVPLIGTPPRRHPPAMPASGRSADSPWHWYGTEVRHAAADRLRHRLRTRRRVCGGADRRCLARGPPRGLRRGNARDPSGRCARRRIPAEGAGASVQRRRGLLRRGRSRCGHRAASHRRQGGKDPLCGAGQRAGVVPLGGDRCRRIGGRCGSTSRSAHRQPSTAATCLRPSPRSSRRASGSTSAATSSRIRSILPGRSPKRSGNVVTGNVAVIDHFGNAITTIRAADIEGAPIRAVAWRGGSTTRLVDDVCADRGGGRQRSSAAPATWRSPLAARPP